MLVVGFLTESEEALLKMSVSQPESGAAVLPDFSSMTEEEQIAYAMQMSLAGGGEFYFIIRFMLLRSYLKLVVIHTFLSFSEYGEMDTGAPMDTAESAKVRPNDVKRLALVYS